MQLLVRCFIPKGAKDLTRKKPPKVWCMRGTPGSSIMDSHLAAMRQPILPDDAPEPRNTAPRPMPQHRSAAAAPPQIRMAAVAPPPTIRRVGFGRPLRGAAPAEPQPLQMQQPLLGIAAAVQQSLTPQQQQEMLLLLANGYCWFPYFYYLPPT
jgi:hypothetical protein